jgi:hypothetical protein
LPALNSATKYPSIPTYHRLDPSNGNLLEEGPISFEGTVVATEKVDGTNARIIIRPDVFIIGSREEFLYAEGDLIHNPALGIVDTLRPIANGIMGRIVVDLGVTLVFYGEVYGGKQTPAWRTYGDGTAGFRLFDIAMIPDDVLEWPVAAIATWRDNGNQNFVGEKDFLSTAVATRCEVVPRINIHEYSQELPTSIQGMRDLLGQYVQGAAVPGPAEGIVFRALDGTKLAKARFQDYDRTLKRRAQ